MAEISSSHNIHEYTVSEISSALKRTIEDRFGYVKLRGEISNFSKASSGHCYLKLKDEDAVLDAVCWRGVAASLPFQPEDGLEVICTGKITIYQGRSTYQLVIETMEVAGEGALMALLEKRKKQFAKEGLFDESRKKPLPYLPQTIGIITSPTGAVIQDMLHRLTERFPTHVLLWPVAVQGNDAAPQIAQAIHGFNNIREEDSTRKPDLVIVARGGGSLEDLWAFNEEAVVRAIAASNIPVISAVGHETDFTLADYVADLRAPTPTAAAEKAVPVRAELLAWVQESGKRMQTGILQSLKARSEYLTALARGLPSLTQIVETRTLRLQELTHRLQAALPTLVQKKEHQLQLLAQKIDTSATIERIKRQLEKIADLMHRSHLALQQHIQMKEAKLESLDKLFNSYHYKNVLKRGFALLRSENGQLITSTAGIKSGETVEVELQDGKKKLLASGAKPKKAPKKTSSTQGDLFG